MTTYIVKNGKGGFVEASEAMRLGYDFNGYNLFEAGVAYVPFEVVECPPEDLQNPSMDASEIFKTETGHTYKAAS